MPELKQKDDTMQRISSDWSDRREHYDVIVVGSGYGAGVAASRLSRAGRKVCVLERGLERLAGEFPQDLTSAQGSMRVDTCDQTLGSPTGLYNLHVYDDVLAMVGCGLGGTSLINANVALEMDPALMALPAWPQAFRADPRLLAPYVERARSMLAPELYPERGGHQPNKLRALARSAHALGQPVARVPIAVNFSDRVNRFGVYQPACNDCGDCTSGCNTGAKNTTQMNYLPDARNHGAEIYTGITVEHVTRAQGEAAPRWLVTCRPTADGADGVRVTLTADIVVLGAGTMGSTEILLRSREAGLPLSERLGHRFSNNGDVLGVAYDADWQQRSSTDPSPSIDNRANINGIGIGSRRVRPMDRPGPCITGVIDLRHSADPLDRVVIEEGVVPSPLATGIVPALFFAAAQLDTSFEFGTNDARRRLLDAQDIGNAVQQSPSGLSDLAYQGATARTQTFLVMSLDEAAGDMRLNSAGRLQVDWPDAGQSPVIARDNDLLRRASEAIHGQFIADPLWSQALGKKLITVHPLGGCIMGDDATQGVVNDACQVYAGASGTAVHDGLYVCDGSVIPAAVGVNPLLTITAVAERACELMAQRHGWKLDLHSVGDGLRPEAAPSALARVAGDIALDVLYTVSIPGKWASSVLGAGAAAVFKPILNRCSQVFSPSLGFSETMTGWLSLRATEPGASVSDDPARQNAYDLAAAWGKAAGQSVAMHFTVTAPRLHTLSSAPDHPAQLSGQVDSPALAARPLVLRNGRFQLLRPDRDRVETWLMSYEADLEGSDRPLRLQACKSLHDFGTSSEWTDLTTLRFDINEPAPEGTRGKVVARGVVTLDLQALLRQLTTLRIAPESALARWLVARWPWLWSKIEYYYLAEFVSFFGLTVFKSYGGMLSCLKNYPAEALKKKLPHRPLKAPAPVREHIALDNGFSIRLTRYRGGDRGPVLLVPGFSVLASSFATDTVDQNFVEALCANGFDVWLFDNRGSADSGSPLQPYTIDDIVRHDWPAAVSHILKATGKPDLQVMGHCVGGMTVLMALLRGMKGVRNLIISQLTLHPQTDWLNDLKSEVGLAHVLAGMPELGGSIHYEPGNTDFDHQMDVMAWKVPIPEGEGCKHPVCKRIFSIIGASYTHAQLNDATHTSMTRMFGPVALAPFDQLSRIMQAGQVVDSQGRDIYLRRDLAEKHLKLPILFIAGARNQLFLPETSLRTHHWLECINGPELYRRKVYADYAHMDFFIGRNAARDIYPDLIAELGRYA